MANTIFILVFKNSDKTKRAFIKKTEKAAKKMVEEMIQGGWEFCSIEEVDCIMYDTIKISQH